HLVTFCAHVRSTEIERRSADMGIVALVAGVRALGCFVEDRCRRERLHSPPRCGAHARTSQPRPTKGPTEAWRGTRGWRAPPRARACAPLDIGPRVQARRALVLAARFHQIRRSG